MKTMFPQGFRNRGSVEILTLVHVLYGYKVMYQKCLTSNLAAMYQQFVMGTSCVQVHELPITDPPFILC